MPTSITAIPLNTINSFTLAQTIATQQSHSIFPRLVELTSTDLLIDSTLDLALPDQSNLNKQTNNTIIDTDNGLELIVFDQLTIDLLVNLMNDCTLVIQAINAINHRNNEISYRFKVSCQNFINARETLAQFALTHNIEAALINNAPKLSVPGLLVMDMDSTTIEIECIDEIAALAGVGEEVAAVTELAMQGKLDFAQSLHQRVGTLKGAPETILAQVAENIPLMPGLETLIKELKLHNWRIAIASGGFTYFSEHLQKLLNLDATFANVLEIEENIVEIFKIVTDYICFFCSSFKKKYIL